MEPGLLLQQKHQDDVHCVMSLASPLGFHQCAFSAAYENSVTRAWLLGEALLIHGVTRGWLLEEFDISEKEFPKGGVEHLEEYLFQEHSPLEDWNT